MEGRRGAKSLISWSQPRQTLADAILLLKAARAKAVPSPPPVEEPPPVPAQAPAKRKAEEGEEKEEKKARLWQHEDPPPPKLAGENWESPREKLKLIGELTEEPWTYFLKDESRRSFAAHLANPLGKARSAAWFAKVRMGTKWLQPSTRWGPMPRKTAWMVAQPCSCSYYYGGMEVQPIAYPMWMLELMQEVMPKCGFSDLAEMPDSCNLNLYEDGTQMVGWHADDEDLFQGKSKDIRIISLSLGATRHFELELNWPAPEEVLGAKQQLADGDICTMEGMTQKHYMHRVPEEEKPIGQRINLTWRWVAKHETTCKRAVS